jgi:hypothetical protein
MFRVAKLSRILRLGALIRNLNIPQELKALLNLAKLTFYYYMIIHVIGCSLYAVVLLNKDEIDQFGKRKNWIPPFHWVNY